MKVLVTGAAGFIGSALTIALASRGDEVVGIDSLTDYYDVRLKYGRLARAGFEFPAEEEMTGSGESGGMLPEEGKTVRSTIFPKCSFVRMSICDKQRLDSLFEEERFDKVVNLAAQAGVRYSIENPYSYLEANLHGFLNILEACRNNSVSHLVYASSSSVYGLNTKVPFSEEDRTDSPVSLYGATKKANELMAHAYSKLYGFATTGLRFFTVYGPWGRPDMSPMLFTRAIDKGEPIKVFNGGDMLRDFTYIDDIVRGTVLALDSTPLPENCPNAVPAKVYNIGCSNPVRLMDFISEIERAFGKEAEKIFLPMQDGDVYQTDSDSSKLETELGYRPSTGLREGIAEFMEWYRSDRNPLKQDLEKAEDPQPGKINTRTAIQSQKP